MITVFSEAHVLRNARTELFGGQLVAPHECPERAQRVLDRVREVGLGEVVAPRASAWIRYCGPRLASCREAPGPLLPCADLPDTTRREIFTAAIAS